ncbi:MAG: hypothetical protein ACFB51_03690 [Anaerolineae bacterium]
MNPQEQLCPNSECDAKDEAGHITIHSRKERRYKCKACGKTFAETKGTALYGIKKSHETFIVVVTLLAYGCPVQAIVAAFGLDERTVRSWLEKAGEHCQMVHEHMMATYAIDLMQVQADELKVKTQQGTVWMALAMMVSTRFWLGGVVSPKRDKACLRQIADMVKQWALCRDILIAVDGWVAYLDVFRKAFRHKVKGRGRGRPRLVPWPELHIVQVVKKRTAQSLTVARRIVQGSERRIDQLIAHSQGHGGINTSYIERLNGTFRQRLGVLVRRTRCLARTPETLTWGMYLVGGVYNFCTYHTSLRQALYWHNGTVRWVKRTPAMAMGLSEHCWSVHELLTHKVPRPTASSASPIPLNPHPYEIAA